jgi:hypothetical protein
MFFTITNLTYQYKLPQLGDCHGLILHADEPWFKSPGSDKFSPLSKHHNKNVENNVYQDLV